MFLDAFAFQMIREEEAGQKKEEGARRRTDLQEQLTIYKCPPSADKRLQHLHGMGS